MRAVRSPTLALVALLALAAPTGALVSGTPGDTPADPAGPTTTATTGAVLPVDGPVTRYFERPPQRWAAGHRGVDLAAEPGTPVRSPVPGVVSFAGPVAGRTVLTVRRADGLLSSLEPLADVVATGTAVEAGDVVGVVGGPEGGAEGDGGAGGHCPASCLHWGVRVGGDYVDPLELLGKPVVVLLP